MVNWYKNIVANGWCLTKRLQAKFPKNASFYIGTLLWNLIFYIHTDIYTELVSTVLTMELLSAGYMYKYFLLLWSKASAFLIIIILQCQGLLQWWMPQNIQTYCTIVLLAILHLVSTWQQTNFAKRMPKFKMQVQCSSQLSCGFCHEWLVTSKPNVNGHCKFHHGISHFKDCSNSI